MNSFKKTFSTTKQMLSLIWKYKSGKKYILFKSITALLGAVRQLLYMVLPGLIINELVLLKATDNLIIYIALSVLLPVFFSVVDNALSYATFCCYQQINMKLKYDFEYHLVHMDYETIENPDIQNLKDRAEDVLDGLLGIVNQLYSLIENVILIFS